MGTMEPHTLNPTEPFKRIPFKEPYLGTMEPLGNPNPELVRPESLGGFGRAPNGSFRKYGVP